MQQVWLIFDSSEGKWDDIKTNGQECSLFLSIKWFEKYLGRCRSNCKGSTRGLNKELLENLFVNKTFEKEVSNKLEPKFKPIN